MADNSKAINEHYGPADLSQRVITGLNGAGKMLEELTLDDLAQFDQLHAGGRSATRALATLANLHPGSKVLDIGSGIGGPARTLAAEFGCQVVGIDLTKAYCEVAEMLTAKVGLDDKVSFRHGSALDLPFEDSSFDVVWTQNAIMNIADKAQVFREARRVLKSRGVLPVQAVFMGSGPLAQYPVLWAKDPSVSFLVTPNDFRRMMAVVGFEEQAWRDVTGQDKVIAGLAEVAAAVPALGQHILHENLDEKRANTIRGFKEGRLLDIHAVFTRGG